MSNYFTNSQITDILRIQRKILEAQYSYDQKISILHILDAIMFADKKTHDKELKLMELFLSSFS